MKITFDNEQEKNCFCDAMANSSYCPSYFNLDNQDCRKNNCFDCWEEAVETYLKG